MRYYLVEGIRVLLVQTFILGSNDEVLIWSDD